MPLSDFDCANLCAACYENTEVFDRVIDIEGVWIGVAHYEDCSAIAFRGSTYLDDWLRNFRGNFFEDDELGNVEAGFIIGLRKAKIHLLKVLDPWKPLYITGHSLGAARALIFAALWHLGKEPIEVVVTFGSPRPGARKLVDILSPIEIRSYHNNYDPVTKVPPALPGIEYQHPRDLIAVDVPPMVGHPWGLFARHHIELYQEAMRRKCATV